MGAGPGIDFCVAQFSSPGSIPNCGDGTWVAPDASFFGACLASTAATSRP